MNRIVKDFINANKGQYIGDVTLRFDSFIFDNTDECVYKDWRKSKKLLNDNLKVILFELYKHLFFKLNSKLDAENENKIKKMVDDSVKTKIYSVDFYHLRNTLFNL